MLGDPEEILVEGSTCWRIARADRLAVIVDAADYFAAAKAAILQAQHVVLLIGWDFDTRIKLEPDQPASEIPDDLGEFLTYVVTHRPELQIYVLRWDLSVLKMPFRGMTPLVLLDWLKGDRLHFRLDHEHPVGGCHHQKIVVVDDTVAFCGGIDMTTDRWDTPAHQDDDPRRIRPSGEPYGPWHDTTAVVDGEAAQALGELARRRWLRATGEAIPPAPHCDPCWPEKLQPDFTDVAVAISRTEPAYDGQDEIHEIEALYLAAIRAAKHSIYIETQYFASQRIAGALCERLCEEKGPEVVVINPEAAEGWLEEEAMGSARAVLLQDIRKADRHGRFRISTPVTEGRSPIYVHAKVLIIDDVLLRIGSSNLNNRSMGYDTECDLALEVRRRGSDRNRYTIARIRNELLAEHLAVRPDEIAAALDSRGSLIGAIESFIRDTGRSLVPFAPPELSELEEELVRSRLLDPQRPEEISEALRRGLEPNAVRAAIGTALISLAAALGLAAMRKR